MFTNHHLSQQVCSYTCWRQWKQRLLWMSQVLKSSHSMLSQQQKACSSSITAPSNHVNYWYLTTWESTWTPAQPSAPNKPSSRLPISGDNWEYWAQGSDCWGRYPHWPHWGCEWAHLKVNAMFPVSFQNLFWMQQQKASAFTNACSMWWDTLIIGWCLYLKQPSSRAYEMLWESGWVTLPSQRTLRDYTLCEFHHWLFYEVDKQLMTAAKAERAEEWESVWYLSGTRSC